jgi:hypothetical protein
MARDRITSESVVAWSPAPVATQINGEVVLMSMERNRCYGFDLTGSDVWQRISAPIRVADLCSQLREEYEAPASEIEADIVTMLNRLADEGLIEVK